MQEIFNKIISYLDGVFGWGNPSLNSVYANMASKFSSVIYSLQQEIVSSQEKTINAVIQNRYGKPEWYVSYALAFQTGYNVSVNMTNPSGFLPYYEVIDENAQIIAQASFRTISLTEENENKGLNILTVAALDPVTGFLIPLTSSQLLEFESYMGTTKSTNIISGNVQIPGIPLLINSLPPNIITYSSVNVYYNSSYDLSFIKERVISEMLNFVKKTTLGSSFTVNVLEQYIMSSVSGVVNFAVQNPSFLNEDGSYSPIIDYVFLKSGYFNFSEDYQDNIVYIPFKN